MAAVPFLKMHGLGNDFVVLDARSKRLDLSAAQRRRLADRHFGIGCDQLVTLENPVAADADVFMRIHNADGSEARACGNATRCVAWILSAEQNRPQVTVQTTAGLLKASVASPDEITIDLAARSADLSPSIEEISARGADCMTATPIDDLAKSVRLP